MTIKKNCIWLLLLPTLTFTAPPSEKNYALKSNGGVSSYSCPDLNSTELSHWKANDGSLDNYCQTCSDSTTWWQVQLAQRTHVEYVKIYKHVDDEFISFIGASLEIYDGTTLMNKTIINSDIFDTFSDHIAIRLNEFFVTTKVRVEQNNGYRLRLVEVEVYGAIVSIHHMSSINESWPS